MSNTIGKMKTNRIQFFLCLLSGIFFTLLFSSCNGNRTDSNTDQPLLGKYKIYKGDFRVTIDRSLEPILKQEVEIFRFIYDSVNMTVEYANEAEMLNNFRERNTDVLVMARELTPAEKESLKEQDTIYAREMKVAYDAVALVGNNNFQDANLSVALLKDYFNPANKITDSPKMVFDNQHSSCVNFVMQLLGYKEKVSSNVYALKSVEEVIDYVAQNANAIGFIPYSYLSDLDEERVQAIRKRIKILSLRVQNSEGKEEMVNANQSDIASGTYPLIRTVSTVTHFTYNDNLEWLFVNFLYQAKGARIFLKAGLIPAKMPEREINVNTESLGAKN